MEKEMEKERNIFKMVNYYLKENMLIDYLFNKKYNGKGYDKKGNILYELKNGNGKIKEYENDV